MSNVIARRTFMPVEETKMLKIVKPPECKKINFHLLGWFRKIYQNYLKRQDELKQHKIKALKDAAYKFYLDYYLTYTKGTVDIHESLYKSGYAICQYAKDMAEMQVMKRVKEGRLDECYKALLKMKKSGKI